MVLLDGLFLGGDGGAIDRRLLLRRRAGLQLREALGQLVHLGLGEAARQGGHQPTGAVVLPLPPAQPVAGHGSQGLLGAQDGPGQGRTFVHCGGQPLRYQVLRAVLIHSNLLQHHAPLGLHVLLGEAGVEQHIA